MESKKNKKSPKKGRKKALSPSKQIAPFKLSLEKNSPKPNINIESNDKNDNNNKPKSPNKEKLPEKVEEKNDIKKKSDESIPFDFIEDENISHLYLNELGTLSGDTISNSLKKMEKGDDMDILNELIKLREYLFYNVLIIY